jgi:c-di-GMP-binding flagellar brake protein YcgR
VSDGSERRRAPRLSTSGRPYRVWFEFQGREVRQARLANISSTGCALEIQMAEAWNLESGSVIKELYLDHEDLPFLPLEGFVVRLLGKVPGKTSGYVLAGVDFTLITPFVQELIEAHIEAHISGSEA